MANQVSASGQTQLSAPAGKIPIIVVPGIMGSRLMDSSGKLVWNPMGKPVDWDLPIYRLLDMFDPGAFAANGERLADLQPLSPAKLDEDQASTMPWSDLQRGAPIRNLYACILSCYAELCYALHEQLPGLLSERGSTLVPQVYVAGYDWRQSNADSANNHLAPVVAQALSETGADKVILIAHSLGGQVSRYYARKNPSKVAAFIALASPHIGAVQPYTRLKQGVVWSPLQTEYDDMVTWGLTVALGVSDPWECALLLRSFPSMYQLMANKHFFAASTWLTYAGGIAGHPFNPAEGGQGPPPQGVDIYYDLFPGLTELGDLRQEAIVHLDAAYAFHEVLTENGQVFQPPNSFCAYADDLDTQVRAHVPDYGKLWQSGEKNEYLGEPSIEVTKKGEGDTAVPAISGCPKNVSRAFLEEQAIKGVEHGSFANHPDVVAKTLEWLTDFLSPASQWGSPEQWGPGQ